MSTTVLRDSRIVGAADAPVDVLLIGGLVHAIGGTAEVRSASPDPAADVDVVDLDGRFLAPGLWDQHTHFAQWAMRSGRIDVEPAASAAHAARIVADHLAAHPPRPAEGIGRVVVGTGFRDGLWPDLPDLDTLELGGVPVALISGDVHCVWANAAALQLLGLPAGEPVLREQAAFDVNIRLSRIDEATLDARAADAARAAAARGVVGIVDLDMDYAPGAWMRRISAGQRGLRVRAGVYPDALDRAIADGVRTGEPLSGTGGLGLGGSFKIFADGSLNTRTALCHEPYPGLHGPEAHGIAIHDPHALEGLMRLGLEHGLAPTVHAIGDRANTMALDAFEAIGCPGRIEHAQLLAGRDLPRFAALGVTASVQPEHALDDRDVADHYWAGRTDRAYAFRDLLDAGAGLLFGSDAPVAPLDPFRTMAAAVGRERDGREPWHPEQRITAAEALRASVDGARVRVGASADVVVTELDPLTATGEQLCSMPVWGTMLAGDWTHRA